MKNKILTIMKDKIPTILFLIFFIPFLLLVIRSIYYSIVGVEIGFLGPTILYYGLEAYGLFFTIGLIFWHWYVYLACLIAQIVILIILKVNYEAKIQKLVIIMASIYTVVILIDIIFLGITTT